VVGEDLDGGGGTRGGGAIARREPRRRPRGVVWTLTVEVARCRGAREGGAVGEAPVWMLKPSVATNFMGR
jgi:hypothetical protein